MQGKYNVVYLNNLYKGGDIDDAFIIWAYILKTKLKSKPYSMDFTMLTEQLFSTNSSDEEASMNGFFTLEDDDL